MLWVSIDFEYLEPVRLFPDSKKWCKFSFLIHHKYNGITLLLVVDETKSLNPTIHMKDNWKILWWPIRKRITFFSGAVDSFEFSRINQTGCRQRFSDCSAAPNQKSCEFFFWSRLMLSLLKLDVADWWASKALPIFFKEKMVLDFFAEIHLLGSCKSFKDNLILRNWSWEREGHEGYYLVIVKHKGVPC